MIAFYNPTNKEFFLNEDPESKKIHTTKLGDHVGNATKIVKLFSDESEDIVRQRYGLSRKKWKVIVFNNKYFFDRAEKYLKIEKFL